MVQVDLSAKQLPKQFFQTFVVVFSRRNTFQQAFFTQQTSNILKETIICSSTTIYPSNTGYFFKRKKELFCSSDTCLFQGDTLPNICALYFFIERTRIFKRNPYFLIEPYDSPEDSTSRNPKFISRDSIDTDIGIDFSGSYICLVTEQHVNIWAQQSN